MKKYLILLLLLVPFLTGCFSSANEVICTVVEENEGSSLKLQVIGSLDDNDIVEDISATMEADTVEIANQLYLYLDLANYSLGEDEKLDIELKGKTIYINNYGKMLEAGNSLNKMTGIKKDEFIKKLKQSNSSFKCE